MTDDLKKAIELAHLDAIAEQGKIASETLIKHRSALDAASAAHDWLMRFESQLRQFIDRVLTQAFGSNWTRHKLPNGLYEQWEQKQRRAADSGRPCRALICYADFTDYERVITKRDLWPYFAPYFGAPECLRESLQRLYLPRIETMHARPISLDDELYVFAEVKRLVGLFVRFS